MDRLREGDVALTPGLSTLLLQCNDQIGALVAAAETGQDESAQSVQVGLDLVLRLQAAGGEGAARKPDSQPAEVLAAGLRRWHVSVRFSKDIFRNGMDPLALLNYVRGLGDIPRLACLAADVPLLDAIDGEDCYLGFQFSLDTAATREEISAAFSFVREDCELHLIEPGASPSEFAALIEAMPDSPRLGDILVAVGAISRLQLQQALQDQQRTAAQEKGPVPALGEILQVQNGLNPQVVQAALHKQGRQRQAGAAAVASGAPASGDENRYIRVQADRLDAVINLLGELVTASAGAALLARQSRQGSLIEANQQIGGLVEEIRNGTLQLRMVPVGETFARFRRVVRDTAAELGKEVQLDIVGGDTELDKSVVERIADPLMHLVRNALDHGLEPAAERAAAGKPGLGRLTLSACHEGGNILIRIRDDGRGIHRERVLQRARERGLVEAGATPPDEDILKLIFAAGFSTAEKVTNLSGRGVGMDVVMRNIEALRGSVSIASEQGQGSQIEIRLPLTLAIIDGFLIGVGNSRFIFPLDTVVEVIENRPRSAATDSRGRSMVELRGQALPVVSLRELYGLASTEPERSSVLVLQAGTRRYGVMVDQLLGQHQTVIKPLGRMFNSLPGMSGSSILGNGEVALIFDVGALHQLAESPPRSRVATQRPNPHPFTLQGQAS